MDIKIPSGSPDSAVADAVSGSPEATAEVGPSDGAGETGANAAVDGVAGPDAVQTSPDLVAEIAADLGAGNITADQAVDRILTDVMDISIVETAPDELRTEMLEVLKDLLETDPYLRSLTQALNDG